MGSLLAQNNKRRFIATIIDDGSTDDTLNIAESFKKHINLRIIPLPENKGVGNARQVGLDTNECDLICFLDSDDKFMPQTTSVYLREMNAGFPDVLYSDFISEQQGHEMIMVGKSSITWFHGKCYRKSFLDKFDVKMPPNIRYNEDSGFSTIVHELAEKKAYIPEPTYYWSENPNSITRGVSDFNRKSIPNFVGAIQFAFNHIAKYQDIWSKQTFYSQLNNFYYYYMDALYRQETWAPDIKLALQKYFTEFWVEEKIRPNLLVRAFTEKVITGKNSLNPMTKIDFISEMAQIPYTVQDFRVLDKDEENIETPFKEMKEVLSEVLEETK